MHITNNNEGKTPDTKTSTWQEKNTNGVFLRLPDNLNLDNYVLNHPITAQKGFKIEKLQYLCYILRKSISRLDKKTFFHPKLKAQKGMQFYVPLKSKYLLNMIGTDYLSYLEALVEMGIVYAAKTAIVGYVSNSFRLADEYIFSDSVRVMVKDFTFCQKLKNGQMRKSKSEQAHLKHMKKMILSGRLTLDIEEATQRNEYLKQLGTHKKAKKRSTGKRTISGKKFSDSDGRYAYNRNLIQSFADMDFFFQRNEDHYRVYSTFTQIPKIFRDLLRFDGKELVLIDLKNSQFLMSTMLLDESIWRERSNNKVLRKIWKNIVCKSINADKVKTIQIMSHLEAIGKKGKDQLSYVQSVANGAFYEDLIDDFIAAGHIEPDIEFVFQRKKAKNLIIASLFDKNYCGRHKLPHSIWNILKSRYPEIVRVFDFIKFNCYKDMARLLQRIEAIFVIDMVCKRLHKEHPKVPIFLLHDCITTTIGNEAIVAGIMKEEMVNFLGFEAKTEVKPFSDYKNELNLPDYSVAA